MHTDPSYREPKVETASSGVGRTLAIAALVAVGALGAAWAAGLFKLETQGELEAPKVRVEGGSVPQVNVETADVRVGTREEVVELPTVEVTPPAGTDRR